MGLQETGLSIQLAKDCDKDEIVGFIKDNWRLDHIFVEDRHFFDYEMCPNGQPNYIIAKVHNKIVGILGFITNNSTLQDSELTLALIKVLPNKSYKNAGIKMLHFIKNLTSKDIHCVGTVSYTHLRAHET